MKNKIIILLNIFLLFSAYNLVAQKKIDQLIPNEEKKKVEKAKRLLNDFQIYEGEKILKDLVKQHPKEAYYHEALVQVQRQVLRNIKSASSEIVTLFPKKNPSDTTANATDTLDEFGNKILPETTKTKTEIDKPTFDDFGLDLKVKKKKDNTNNIANEEVIPTEATVTIDSSLITDSNGEIVKPEKKTNKQQKSLEKEMKNLETLSQIPYEGYKFDFIQNCRNSTLQLNTVDSASFYLREFLVDTIDTDLYASDEALENFENGLDEFYSKNIPKAAKLFEKAIELYPDFYKAKLYLGDTYYLMNKDTTAIRQYFNASQLKPNLPDAYEKLALAFYAKGQYEHAASQIIEAILIYPQQHYFTLLKRIINKTGHDFDLQWIPREVFPISTQQMMDEKIATDKTPWWHYQAAKQDIYSYYSPEGFVRPNDKTTIPYIEQYAWRKMLNNSGKQNFLFARAMDKMGYLECYYFISLFHQDLYAQFKDFVFKNPEKVRKYFTVLINWDEKKYDKVKKEVGIPIPERAKPIDPYLNR